MCSEIVASQVTPLQRFSQLSREYKSEYDIVMLRI